MKLRRIALGLTQIDLANLWEVPQATISRWEGEKHPIQHPAILDLALKYLEMENKLP